jgi:hypothetical protein
MGILKTFPILAIVIEHWEILSRDIPIWLKKASWCVLVTTFGTLGQKMLANTTHMASILARLIFMAKSTKDWSVADRVLLLYLDYNLVLEQKYWSGGKQSSSNLMGSHG